MASIFEQENALLKQELELQRKKLEIFEQQQRKTQAAAADAAVNAQKQRDAQWIANEAEKQRRFAELNIPKPESLKSYSALSPAVKCRLIENFGSDFPAEIAAKERSGMDWQTWDKLNHPERFPVVEDFVASDGYRAHFDQELGKWMPGPTPEKE